MYSATQNFHFLCEVICLCFPLSSMLKMFTLQDLQAHSVHITACFFPRRGDRHQTPLEEPFPSTQNRLQEEGVNHFPNSV